MRLAYICADPGVPVFGAKGASVHVQEVIRAFRRLGIEVVLFATRCGGEPPADLLDLEVRRIPLERTASPAERERACLAANAGLLRMLATDRIGFDAVYERYSLWSRAGVDHAGSRGLPALVEVNAPLIEEQVQYRELVDREAALDVARRVFAGARRLVAVSTGVADYLSGFADPGVISVVPNGVDPVRFEMAPPRASGPIEIGFVGTLKPWHGLGHLLEACALVRDAGTPFRLRIVGDGPERQPCEARIDALGLKPFTRLVGAVGPERVPAEIGLMDVAVAPYPALANFYFSPLKVMEYMAAGRAVVASRIGDIPAILEDERTGLLVEPGDPEQLASAIRRLDGDRGLLARLGAAARRTAVVEYSWDGVVRRVLADAGITPPAGLESAA